MDKNTIPSGQTAFVNFKVTNSRLDIYVLNITGLPDMPACSGYSVRILHQPESTELTKNPAYGNACVLNGQFKYLPIAPGTTYIQKIDLSVYLDLRVRGDYLIEATYSPFWTRERPPAIAATKGTFSFRVE
ncbi:MAG TPA: hypothetical protein VGG95_04420 [Edaphobacter sp.]|jgi:tellurite resistance-related uncharacterized protein